MADVKQMAAEFQAIAADPGALMKRYLSEGKKVAGCFPSYVPEEIVHAAGMVPMGLWGGQVTPAVAGKYNPVFTCSIMRSCMEYGMKGVYDGLSCVVMPMLCDTFRGMSGAWRVAVPSIPLIAFIHPQNRGDSGAEAFLEAEYETVHKRLQEITGHTITEEMLQHSIDVYNAHGEAMRAFCAVANDHLDIVTPVVRHAVMKSGRFMEKEEHTKLVQAFTEALKALPKHAWAGKKVVLTGITAEPDDFLQMFESQNIAVVADDLAQESRQYRTPIPAGGKALARLAKQWQNRVGCSMIHEERPDRGKMLADMAKETGADGVAICLMRFCDVEEYDFPYVTRDVEAAGYPSVCLEIDQSTQNNEQNRTKIEVFAELIK